MSSFEVKEARLIGSINELLDALDVTIAQMEDPSNAAIGYDAHARAIAQLEAIVRKEEKLDKLYAKAEEKASGDMDKFVDKQEKLELDICRELAKLDETLGKLESTDSKIIGFVEQKKAIHEIKNILKTAEKLEA